MSESTVVDRTETAASAEAEESRAGTATDAAAVQAASESPEAEEPTWASADEYLESLEKSRAEGAKAADPKPAPQSRSPLRDPRAAEDVQQFRQAPAGRQQPLDG